MKWLILWLVVSVIGLGVTIGFTLSDNGMTFYASGKLKMDVVQWENFKSDIFSDKFASIDKVSYLDSGDVKVVSFNHMRVEDGFKYGDLVYTREDNYGGNIHAGYTVSFLCIVFSILSIFIVTGDKKKAVK